MSVYYEISISYFSLLVPIYRGEEVDFSDVKVDKLIPPLKLSTSSGLSHGFTLIGDSGDTEKAQRLKVKFILFVYIIPIINLKFRILI